MGLKTNQSVTQGRLAVPTAIGPAITLCFVILFKILKVGRAYLSWFEARTIVMVVLAAAFAAAIVFAGSRIAFHSWGVRFSRARVVGVVALSIFAGEAAVAFFTGSIEWMTIRLLGILSMDIALFAFVLFGVLFLGRYRPRAGLVISLVMSVVLLLMYSVEAAFFLRTGTVGNWLLLKFLVMSYDVAGAVKEDVDVQQMLWLVGPQIILLLSVYGSWRFRGRSDLRSSSRRSVTGRILRPALAAGVLFLAVHGLFRTEWLPPSYQVHTGSLVVGIARDLLGGSPIPNTVEDRNFDLPSYGTTTRLVAKPGSAKRNIVFLVLESTRAFSAPPHNMDGLWMPFLDSLARRSVVAERMYTTVPYTTEALLALFGGVVPAFSTTTTYADHVGAGWPALLADQGYSTAFFTATFLNDKRDERALLRKLGFAKVIEARDIGATASDFRTYSGIEDKALLEPTLAWIDSVAAAGEPFVASCLTQSSHHPYVVPSSQVRRDAGVRDPELDAYLNTLTYADDFLRMLFKALRDRDLLESTTLVFVGDHGESFGEHGARFHGMNVWEEGVRVPLVIYDALSENAQVLPGPFQQIDLFPTVVDLAGFELTPPVSGTILISSGNARKRLYLASAGSQAIAIVADSLKFVYHYRRRPMQVFNLTSDPRETVDISGSFDPEVLSDAEVDLLLWQRQVNARP